MNFFSFSFIYKIYLLLFKVLSRSIASMKEKFNKDDNIHNCKEFFGGMEKRTKMTGINCHKNIKNYHFVHSICIGLLLHNRQTDGPSKLYNGYK